MQSLLKSQLHFLHNRESRKKSCIETEKTLYLVMEYASGGKDEGNEKLPLMRHVELLIPESSL